MEKRALITGASGLLGRHIYKEFRSDPSWETMGLAFSRTRGDLRKVDITDPDQVRDVFAEFKPTVIVHSAAEKIPSNFFTKPEATKVLNIDATRTICEEANKIGAVVLFISTDYVFDGTKPPYQIDDIPNPLNIYAQSKLDGEVVIRETANDGIIFRVCMLYGEVEMLEESAVTVLLRQIQNADKECLVDDYHKRYPTYSGDIAWVIRELLDKRVNDPALNGIFHWSADEQMTKYDMAIAMANVLDISTDHIKRFYPEDDPDSDFKRPYDSHIDSQSIEKLGIQQRTPYKEAIAISLQRFV